MPQEAEPQPGDADWDIVSGVGLTAIGVAAVRAMEAVHDHPLVTDPYAASFVRAAASQLPSPLPVTPEEAARDAAFPWFTLSDYVAVRSRFFDEFFTMAGDAGIGQVVILAAGLDTRAFRLEWPSGMTVFEVDAPLVLAFKDHVLGADGAAATCDRRTVASDLREDWTAALRAAGFDTGRPAAWLAEGLFPYLTRDAQESLLASVHEISAPGSRFAVEFGDADMAAMADEPAIQEAASRVDWDFVALWETGERRNPASWLHDHGWTVAVTSIAAAADRYGRPLDVTPMAILGASLLISAEAI